MNIETMSKEDLQLELQAREVKYHHKAGAPKLREILKKELDAPMVTEDEDGTEASVTLSKKQSGPNLTDKEKRMTPKEREALKLVRVIVSPNDPLMSTYPGLIFTVGSSKVNKGKMIKKYVPFNNEAGWHVPHIIYELIEAAEMQKFKSVRMPNGEKGLESYLTKKFNVTVLPALTRPEMKALAAAQAARGDT